MATFQRIALTGSFAVDDILPPKLDLHVGAKSHIFQPPATPSASSSLCRSSTSLSNDHGSVVTSRKRSHHDTFTSDLTTSYSPTPPGLSTALHSPGTMSPVPFVNTQYILAGGLETPTTCYATAINRSDDDSFSPDLTLRGGRGWDRSCGSSVNNYLPEQLCMLSRESNGRSRHHKTQPTREGWGKTVHSVVGVAGKVWNFCRLNAFRGFYAGVGQGFQMYPSTSDNNREKSFWDDLDERDDVFRQTRETSSIPGCFPEEDFISDYMSQDHTFSPRPAKKIQREKGGGDLRASWVIVGSVPTSRESSPTRLSARKVPSFSSPGRRPTSKAGRRPVLPASRPLRTSYAGSPALRYDRPASFASTRSPVSTPKHESPVNAQVQKHAARIKRREMEDEAHLMRFNQQLKAMIKEGKEALGTKFEVEETEDMIDEGYAEGDYYDDKWKG